MCDCVKDSNVMKTLGNCPVSYTSHSPIRSVLAAVSRFMAIIRIRRLYLAYSLPHNPSVDLVTGYFAYIEGLRGSRIFRLEINQSKLIEIWNYTTSIGPQPVAHSNLRYFSIFDCLLSNRRLSSHGCVWENIRLFIFESDSN